MLRNLTKIFFLIFILQSAICNLYGQSITWQRIYDGDGPGNFFDGGFDACDAGNGNFFLVGHSDSTMSRKIWVIKINPQGDTIWTKKVANGIARCVTPSGDGGCVLSGTLPGVGVIKLDSNGNTVWYRSYTGLPGTFQLYDIIKTSDGGYIASGRNVTSTINGYILKIDSVGNLQWQNSYQSLEFKIYNSIIEINGLGYIATGYVYDLPQGDTAECTILKIDLSGNSIWEKRYKIQNKQTTGNSIFNLGDKYLIGGSTTNSLSTISQSYIMEIDTLGNFIYSKVFFSDSSEVFAAMNIINHNRYVIAMIRNSIKTLDGKAIITDSLGNIIRERIFPTPSFIEFRSVLPIANGDILIFGAGEFCQFDCEDYYAVRTDSNLSLPPFIGINTISNSIPNDFELFQNYPNPFNPVTTIKFDVASVHRTDIKLTIYDITGREIAVLVNQNLPRGSYQTEWNAAGFASGIYFVTLLAGTFKLTRKIVLIK